MRRRHLFEIHEEPWCPRLVRQAVLDFLRFMLAEQGVYRPLYGHLFDTLQVQGKTEIIDLCSGGTGPWLDICRDPRANDISLVTCTDAIPASLPKHADPRMRYESMPVKAQDIPDHLNGMCTMFSAAHHFRADELSGMLANAINKHRYFFIAEMTHRRPAVLLRFFCTPLVALVVMPFVGNFSLGRFLLTYIIPIIPLVLCWDGVVSCMRSYSDDEWREIAPDSAKITVQTFQTSVWQLPVTAIVVQPATPSHDSIST